MIEILIWCLFAYGSYTIAKSKNRNETVWAVLGVLFGIFALIVVALLPKVENDNVITYKNKDNL